MKKMRVLLSAYQCGPGMGSVSQIGWEWYSRLASRAQVTLVTHTRNREVLEKAGAPIQGSEIIYVDTEWFAGPLYRFASRIFKNSEHPVFLVSSLDYYVYDWCALRLLKQKCSEGEGWDILHVPTPVSPLAATRLYKLGLPMALGPWNGGLKNPTGFPEVMRSESSWLYPIRKLAGFFDRISGSTRHARILFTATKATKATIPARYHIRCVSMLENAVDPSTFLSKSWPVPPSSTLPLKILFVGRLLPVKGIPMLIDAVARLRDRFPIHLTIVGEGTEEAGLRKQVKSQKVDKEVQFKGALPLKEVALEMQKCHVFCLPSVRESGGAVLLEAMSVSRPVIAIDFGGPAEIVNESVGLKIPPIGREAVTQKLVEAMEDLQNNPEKWQERGIAGRKQVEKYHTWDAKISTALDIFEGILAEQSHAENITDVGLIKP